MAQNRTLKIATNTTRHVQVTDEFRARIASGEWKPGDRLPSYSEVRALHGIHTNTMEKVYAKLEAENLILRRNGSGIYVAPTPVKNSQKARANKTGIIGLSGRGFGVSDYSPYWSHLLGGAREAATRAGMQLLLLDSTSSQGWEKVDGVLVCDWNDYRVPRKDLPGLPMVSLMAPIEGVASAFADESGGMHAVMRHLLDLGHRKIAYLHGHLDLFPAMQHYSSQTLKRFHAFGEALKAADIHPARGWKRNLPNTYDYGAQITKASHRQMALWIKGGWAKLGCTALVCHNDDCALGVIGALTAAGIRVPHDVSVVGFDGTELCDLISPALSSVKVPLREIGALGFAMLQRQINSGLPSDEHQMLPTELQVRGSTCAPNK